MRPRTLSPRRSVFALATFAGLGLVLVAAGQPQPASTPAEAKPTLVSLKMDASLEQVLDELQRQTDIAIDRSRADTSRAVKIDAQNITFWDAVERIAKSSDHRVIFGGQGRTIMLQGGENVTYRERPTALDGVFRVAVRQVQAVYDYDQDAEGARYEVQLTLHWEPKFSAFLVEVPGSKTVTARDNADKELMVGDVQGRMAVSGGGANMSIRLADLARASRTIKVLEGNFHVIGAAHMLEFKFPRVGVEEKSETKDGIKVKVRANFKEGSDLWTARVELEYPEGGPQMESFESGAWLSENSAFLKSVDNKRRMDVNGGSDYDMQGDRKAVINYHWVPPDDEKFGKPADWELVIRTPSRLLEVPVKFRLENIILP